MLTQAKLKSILHYNPETGIFTKKISNGSFKICGSKHHSGCINISIEYKLYHAHRLAFLYMEGTFPEVFVDHINGIRDDNRWCNLRRATASQNSQNQRIPHKNNSTGCLGVFKSKPLKSGNFKFRSKILVNKEIIYLGTFETKELASEAYLKAKEKFHSFFTTE